MNDKRDEVIEAAKQYATETNCLMKGHILSIRHQQDAAYCAAMADFALSREAEIRRQIADELGELRSNVVDVEFLQGRLDIFEEQIRGNK